MDIYEAEEIFNDIISEYGDQVSKMVWQDVQHAVHYDEKIKGGLSIIALTNTFDSYEEDNGPNEKVDQAWLMIMEHALLDD